MASDSTTVAWLFDDKFWGICGQGDDEPAALAELGLIALGRGDPAALDVVERVRGDELAFERDRQPATDRQRALTIGILEVARVETIELIGSCTPAMLDFDDPDRTLPAWASWRTLRQMAWHLVNTESRYYLPSLGLGYREPATDLLAELDASRAHVRAVVEAMPLDLTSADGNWTSTKLLRRLAWHERSELVTMRAMAAKARALFR